MCLTNTTVERLRRWLKSVIFTDDVRFVGSKPSLVTFLLFSWHLFVLLKFNCWTVKFLLGINIVNIKCIQVYNTSTPLLYKWLRKYIESEQGLSKSIYRLLIYAYISFLQTYKPESLRMHFLSAMLYNVDARMLLSDTRQHWDRLHKWVIEIAAHQ